MISFFFVICHFAKRGSIAELKLETSAGHEAIKIRRSIKDK
jgi:hypothetical protein